MNLFGGFVDGGIESKKVVDVPSDIIASLGVERAITLAGLSPVKGAMIHSVHTGWEVKQGVNKMLKRMYQVGNPIFESNRDVLHRGLCHPQQDPL